MNASVRFGGLALASVCSAVLHGGVRAQPPPPPSHEAPEPACHTASFTATGEAFGISEGDLASRATADLSLQLRDEGPVDVAVLLRGELRCETSREIGDVWCRPKLTIEIRPWFAPTASAHTIELGLGAPRKSQGTQASASSEARRRWSNAFGMDAVIEALGKELAKLRNGVKLITDPPGAAIRYEQPQIDGPLPRAAATKTDGWVQCLEETFPVAGSVTSGSTTRRFDATAGPAKKLRVPLRSDVRAMLDEWKSEFQLHVPEDWVAGERKMVRLRVPAMPLPHAVAFDAELEVAVPATAGQSPSRLQPNRATMWTWELGPDEGGDYAIKAKYHVAEEQDETPVAKLNVRPSAFQFFEGIEARIALAVSLFGFLIAFRRRIAAMLGRTPE